MEHDLFLIPLLPLLSEEESGDEKSRGEEKIFKHFPPILFPPSPVNCVKCIHYLIVIRASLKLFCIRFTIKISSIRSESIFEPLALIMFSSLFFLFFFFDFSKSLKFQDFWMILSSQEEISGIKLENGDDRIVLCNWKMFRDKCTVIEEWKSCWKTSDRQWLIELFRGKMERKKDTFWDETRDFIQKEQKNPILIRGSVVFL